MNCDLQSLLLSCLEWHPVGSRVTCSPPPKDTDCDYLCVVSDRRQFALDAAAAGFTYRGSMAGGEETLGGKSPFLAMKRASDRVDLIVTQSGEFAALFMRATRLSARFNLLEKADRVALFQAVLYGNG